MTRSSDRVSVTCKASGSHHYLNEREHTAASSFCPDCGTRNYYETDVLGELD